MQLTSSNLARFERLRRLATWHEWFAWRPARLSTGAIVWLETVERRGGYDHSKNTGRLPSWRWEYRAA